ncbi:MAG TPA: asparagine synthase-related protein [Pyrinomonadaceae bacterium]|nr:asparagine synthase-related protein [Pyrinomonadaceae bacterium]
MSGIVGIVNFDGAPIDRELLERLTKSMTFRGPDAQATWIDGQVGFGHTLLRTTCDVETDKQPLTLDGKVWLTADARIDGRRATSSDAESILQAYERWKTDCVKHLIGDFAFAIWNATTKTLFCARDHFGVKPFYYARTGDTFIFSNTLNTVRLHPSVSDTLNETAIADYLAFGLNQDLQSTTFRDIQRLPDGHTLSVSPDSIIKRRYWTPVARDTAEASVERFHDLLTTATNDRLRTDRVSVSMSGGLDSTSLAAIAVDLLRERPGARVTACTNVYDSLFQDEERRYSSLAADSIGIPLTQLAGDRHSLFDSRSPADLDQPEPFLLSPLAGQFNRLMRELARDSRVALTGYDGDAFMTEQLSWYFQACGKNLRFKTLVSGLAWYVRTRRRLPPVGLRTALRRTFKREESAPAYPPWIDEAFAKRVGLDERWRQANSAPPLNNHTHPSALYVFESKVWAPLFEGYDPGSTKLLVEVRHPFIDVRLVDYLLQIPAIPWCVDKHILRVAMSNRLPAPIVNRPKTPLAGDPTLHLANAASVRWLDTFEVHPELRGFVNLNRRRPLADEQTSARRWANLRVFAFNHWLTNSRPIKHAVHYSLAQTA